MIANKRRVQILEILRDFRGDSLIPENVGNIEQVQALINKLKVSDVQKSIFTWHVYYLYCKV